MNPNFYLSDELELWLGKPRMGSMLSDYFWANRLKEKLFNPVWWAGISMRAKK